MNKPKKPGNEPDPDSTSPTREVAEQHPHDIEPIEEESEPLGGNFA